MVERGPEKAGVGGSTPSLATILSRDYKHVGTHFHSISFQNLGAVRLTSEGMLVSESSFFAIKLDTRHPNEPV